MAKVKESNFLTDTPENADLNQYWYSKFTIDKIVEDIAMNEVGFRVAFLSTPSIYFSMTDGFRHPHCYVFDYDDVWESDRGFVHYDFNHPSTIPESLKLTFDMVVIDPPFITHEVWRQYAVTSQLLLKPGGKVILTTIAENEPLLKELFGASSTKFQPSIPNLVYQYNLYTNYESPVFSKLNPERP